MSQNVNQAIQEVVEMSIRQNRAIMLVFKRNVGASVVAALDAIVEMELQDRIKIHDEDIEKMRFARFEGHWKSSNDDPRATQYTSRCIEMWPGKLFEVSVFMHAVAPGLKEIRPSVHFC